MIAQTLQPREGESVSATTHMARRHGAEASWRPIHDLPWVTAPRRAMPTLAISSQGEEWRKPMSGSDKPMNRKEYEKALRALQVELCALQD